MNIQMKSTAIAATVAAMFALSPSFASAQSSGMHNNNDCMFLQNGKWVKRVGPDCMSTQGQHSDWKYDSSRHRRHMNRDNVFRFEFGGFFYDQPYWQQPGYGYGYSKISCARGRSIVDWNGFDRVRTVECDGLTYTYNAKRHGQTYQVLVNSRRGTITRVSRI